MATKKRKKEDVNGEATQKKRILSLLSLSFFYTSALFFSGIRLHSAFFGSYGRRPTTTSGLHRHKNRKEKRERERGHNVVTTSMFIDTPVFLLKRKRVDKREQKERHSSFINNQGKIVTKTNTPFFLYSLRACFLFSLFFLITIMMMLQYSQLCRLSYVVLAGGGGGDGRPRFCILRRK
jgi:hypothetical protein